MKIAFVLHQFMPFYNSGTEQYVYHMAKTLNAKGHDVRVFCFEPNFNRDKPFTGLSTDSFDGISVTRLTAWTGAFPNYVLAMYYNPFFGNLFREFLEGEGIELVHFFHNYYLSTSVVEEAYLAGVPSVINLMDFWFLCPNVQLLKTGGGLCRGPSDYKECVTCLSPLDANYQFLNPFVHGEDSIQLSRENFDSENIDYLAGSDAYHRTAAMTARPYFIRRVLDNSDLIVSPSNFLKSMFVENGYVPSQIKVVRYGVDCKPLQNIKRDPTGGFRIGYMGTISPHKGLDTLIEAFLKLVGDDISLEIHGDLTAFPVFSGTVRDLAKNDDRIHFHGRFESPQLTSVLGGMDVLVAPSVWYENTPFVILEAQASGTPVIASNLGGLSELVVEGENGYLFEPGDADDLCRKLNLINEDRSLIEKLRPEPSSARSLDDNVDEFLEIYSRLIDEKKKNKAVNTSSSSAENDMDPEKDELIKKNIALKRQTHHLTSQIFHMINLNSGFLRKISDLERVVDDKVFLDESVPSEEGLNIPKDLSPSIRRKLVHLQQLKVVLMRRNELVAELEQAMNTHESNMDLQKESLREANEHIKDIEAHFDSRVGRIKELEAQVDSLTAIVNRWWNNPVYKMLIRMKQFVTGGRGK